MDPKEKLEKLKSDIKKMGGLVVAFSGGVDSTFLLKVAHDVLGERAAAVTVRSALSTQREFNEAVSFVDNIGAKQVVIVKDVFEIEGFSENPVNRCYLCKKQLFSKIIETAKSLKIDFIADGSNIDDLGDYRPGMQAIKELNIVSPLKEAGMTKEDIRVLSKELGLSTWDKPAFACLASRIPYGNQITKEKLDMVERAEQVLLDFGFKQIRVRHHGDVARIEVAVQERNRFFDEVLMDKVNDELKKIGFKYIALDLKGYRTGSMNEGLII